MRRGAVVPAVDRQAFRDTFEHCLDPINRGLADRLSEGDTATEAAHYVLANWQLPTPPPGMSALYTRAKSLLDQFATLCGREDPHRIAAAILGMPPGCGRVVPEAIVRKVEAILRQNGYNPERIYTIKLR